MASMRNGVKNFFGATNTKFQDKLKDIALSKINILEDSEAIFQDKTLHQLESVKDIVSKTEGAVKRVQDFQQTFSEMHAQQAGQWQAILETVEEIKATTRPNTAWEQAMAVFEKNKDALNPRNDTGGSFKAVKEQRHAGTCQWIFEKNEYKDWNTPNTNKLLWLRGEQGVSQL